MHSLLDHIFYDNNRNDAKFDFETFVLLLKLENVC